jgi:uracil-DNA glycosylase family 4
VGQSGKLVRATVAKVAAELQLGNIDTRYTNAVRCRPPDNRDPLPNEMAACAPWLVEELEHMPNLRAVIALGKYGMIQAKLARNVLGLDDLYVTQVWHPAYILRQRRKTKEWEAQLKYAFEEAFKIPHPVVHVDPWIFDWPEESSEYLSADTETDDLEEGVGVKMVGWSLSDGYRGIFTCSPAKQFGHVWLHNAKYDLPLLGIDPYDFSKWDDTMLGIYVLRQHERLSLKEVGPEITGLHWDLKITDLLKERIESCKTLKSGKVKCTGKWVKVPFSRAQEARPEDASRYATTDAVVTARLARYVSEQFDRNPWARAYYLNYEKPLVPVLLGMETRGITIDPDALEVAGKEINERLYAAEHALRDYVPDSIESFTGDAIRPWLLANGIVDGKKTETGKIGIAKGNILGAFKVERREQLPTDTIEGKIADLLLEASAMRKLDSTYVKRLRIDSGRSAAHRIHPRFNGAATDTDRLSSSDPNEQNVPARGPLGVAIRRSHVAAPGHVLVVGDYSQLELRIWAYITQDPFFLGAFVGDNTYDPHTQLSVNLSAQGLYVPRGDAKNTNFAAIYGADDAKLAATAKIPRQQASAFIQKLRSLAPSLSGHKLDTQRRLDNDGFVETLLGWRGYYPLWYSPIRSEQQAALRAAGNVRIQGTASGIVKDLMIAYDEELAPLVGSRSPYFEQPGGLLLQVHDELVIETPIGKEDEVAYKLEELGARIGAKWLKADATHVAVPLKLSVDIGPNWSDAKPK